MKRISCLLLSLLLALLCACGDTNTPAPPDQTEPDEPETPSVPAVCSLYYDYAELEIIAPTNSKLPLAAGASHGAPDYLPLWHNGEYGQLAASGGEGYMVADLTDGTLTADVWMPENIVYQLWAGTITAPGIRYWPETHVLSDTVTIVDPLDAEAADE